MWKWRIFIGIRPEAAWLLWDLLRKYDAEDMMRIGLEEWIFTNRTLNIKSWFLRREIWMNNFSLPFFFLNIQLNPSPYPIFSPFVGWKKLNLENHPNLARTARPSPHNWCAAAFPKWAQQYFLCPPFPSIFLPSLTRIYNTFSISPPFCNMHFQSELPNLSQLSSSSAPAVVTAVHAHCTCT